MITKNMIKCFFCRDTACRVSTKNPLKCPIDHLNVIDEVNFAKINRGGR